MNAAILLLDGLPTFSPISGGHCEISAMTNALVAQDYRVTEPMIAGGGAALGFAFQEGTFPWLSARNAEMRELFFQGPGIAWEKRLSADRHAGRTGISGLLAAGTPVVLRVDMRYLPYRYGGRYGPAYTSFDRHLITLYAEVSAFYRELKRMSTAWRPYPPSANSPPYPASP